MPETDAPLAADAPVTIPYTPALDGVRGLAILAVMVSHIGTSVADRLPTSWGQVVERTGLWGVDVFFALSGYLITGILMGTRGEPGSSVRFYLRRVLRIVPLYVVFLATIFFVFPAFTPWGRPGQMLATAFWCLNLVQGLGTSHPFTAHLWSLAVEEQFYLVWPLALLVIPARRVGPVALAIGATSLAARFIAYRDGAWGEALHRWTPVALDGIALGCWLAWLERSRPGAFARLAGPAPWVAAAASATLLGLAIWVDGPALPAWGRAPAAVLGAALVVIARSGYWDGLLAGRLLVHVGARCYGLYLLHPIPLVAIKLMVERVYEAGISTARWGFACRTLGVLVASFALAELSWLLIEGPSLSLKRYLPYSRMKS